MILLYAFIFGGFICLIGQIILDNTNFTPGHLNAIFVVVGAFLASIGVYEILLKYTGVASSVMITNFGNLLYEGAIVGFKTDGVFGMLKNILVPVSCTLTVTIVMAFLVALISKPKN